jgi:hypothetical protein
VEATPSHMENVIVLGFDARTPLANQSSLWDDKRRSQYLIRLEIPSPISVDRGVWPAVSVNPDEEYPLFLWGSLSEIVGTFPKVATLESDAPAIVEIAVVATDQESSSYWEGIIFGRIDPQKDRRFTLASEFLGYDVADRSLISGVSNCQLSAEELAAVRKDWSRAINAWGLFGDPEDAEAFRAVCDRLVPEHSPFEVYRMRRIAITATSAIN